MSKRSSGFIFVAASALTLVMLTAAPAFAHEGRKLGDLEMEVGWGTEPALAGQPNSALVLLVHHGEPVVDLGDTLEFEVDLRRSDSAVPDRAVLRAGRVRNAG